MKFSLKIHSNVFAQSLNRECLSLQTSINRSNDEEKQHPVIDLTPMRSVLAREVIFSLRDDCISTLQSMFKRIFD